MALDSGQNAVAFPTAGQVMNRARAFVNDAYRGGQGIILKNVAPFTTEYLNGALEELQDRMRNSSAQIVLIEDNIILGPITPVASPDPSIQLSIGYNGFFNGVGNVALPALPSNVVMPLVLEEQVIGSNLPFKPMAIPMEGLKSALQGSWLVWWEYRGNKIYLIGSTQTEQIRMRAQIRQVAIAASDAPNLDNVEIQIPASVNALATIVAYNYARARGAQGMTVLATDAEKFIKMILRAFSRQAQGTYYNRAGYGDAGDKRTGTTRLPY